MSRKVVIVGGGIIGLFAAYNAVQDGFEVTVLERNTPERDGCSYGNAGMVVPSHFVPLAAPGMVKLGLKWMWNPKSPFYIKPRASWDLLAWGYHFWRAATKRHVEQCAPVLRDLNLASRAAYEELADRHGMDFGLTRRGLLMLCRTQHALDEEAVMAREAERLGVPAQVLTADETAKADPGIRMSIAGSILFPKDCHLSPQLLMSKLQEWLLANGAKLVFGAEVSAWKTSNGRVTTAVTKKGDFSADEFVLCGGAWSSVTARDLDLSLPMQAGKGYSLTLTKPRQLPALCSIFVEARVAITPMGDTLRFGGTMELGGINQDPNPLRVQGITESVPKYFPDFKESDFTGITAWSGLRPCSPDGMPFLGRTARWENLVIATGHAMMGISLGPITGKLVGDLLSRRSPRLPLQLLDPDRYA